MSHVIQNDNQGFVNAKNRHGRVAERRLSLFLGKKEKGRYRGWTIRQCGWSLLENRLGGGWVRPHVFAEKRESNHRKEGKEKI